jgi:hypothetical protein
MPPHQFFAWYIPLNSCFLRRWGPPYAWKQSGLPVTEQMVIRKLIDELEEAS